MKGLKDMELIIAACVIVLTMVYLIWYEHNNDTQKTTDNVVKNEEQSSKTEDVKVTDNNKNNIQQETDDKKNASINIKYEDYRVNKDKMKEMLIKAASNLSWSRMFSSSDKLSFVSEFTGRFAIGKINILFEENECSVDCYNDTTEKNELNIKALIIELEAIYEGKENGIGNAVLSDYNKKNSKFGSFLSLVIIVTTVCFFISEGSMPSCSRIFSYIIPQSYEAEIEGCISAIEDSATWSVRNIRLLSINNDGERNYMIFKVDVQNGFGAWKNNVRCRCYPIKMNDGEWYGAILND